MVLLKYDVGYQQCDQCGSVQTDPPYWLDEAYEIPGVHIDVGIASRTIQMWIVITALLERIGFAPEAPALDFGAASGLLCRLMRDSGYNFYAYDRYSRPFFVNYFTRDDISSLNPRLITAIEVFEHLPNPAEAISQLLRANADILLFSTWLADGQADDWSYFVPECGQHVFFYSERGLRAFADRLGYDLQIGWPLHVFLRRSSLDDRTFSGLTEFRKDMWRFYEAAGNHLVRTVWSGSDSPPIKTDSELAMRLFEQDLIRGR
jgi:hypothetical protein